MHANMIRKFLYCYLVSKHVKKNSLQLRSFGKIYIPKLCLRWAYITVPDWLSKDMMFDKRRIALYGRQGILSYWVKVTEVTSEWVEALRIAIRLSKIFLVCCLVKEIISNFKMVQINFFFNCSLSLLILRKPHNSSFVVYETSIGSEVMISALFCKWQIRNDLFCLANGGEQG